ncbi:MAG: hypothetical protein KA712_05725 [Myxococcales bacterium]|nr:hypothetical protein [Myxococcales bacterium]
MRGLCAFLLLCALVTCFKREGPRESVPHAPLARGDAASDIEAAHSPDLPDCVDADLRAAILGADVEAVRRSLQRQAPSFDACAGGPLVHLALRGEIPDADLGGAKGVRERAHFHDRQERRLKIGLLLLEAGAPVDQRDEADNSALHAAMTFAPGHTDSLRLIVRALLQRGARPSLVNGRGLTPLELAQRWSRENAALLREELDAVGRR